MRKKKELENLKLILINSRKGGTGKTTFGITLASLLSMRDPKNKKICFVEMDSIGTCLSLFFPNDENKQPSEIRYINEFLLEGSSNPNLSPEDFLYTHSFGDNSIDMAYLGPFPSQQMELNDISYKISDRKNFKDKFIQFVKYLDEKRYEWLIIDNTPGFYNLTSYVQQISILFEPYQVFVTSAAHYDIKGFLLEIDMMSEDIMEYSAGQKLHWFINYVPKDSYEQVIKNSSIDNLASFFTAHSYYGEEAQNVRALTRIASKLTNEVIKQYYFSESPHLRKLHVAKKPLSKPDTKIEDYLQTETQFLDGINLFIDNLLK